jgi:hypothetical protein
MRDRRPPRYERQAWSAQSQLLFARLEPRLAFLSVGAPGDSNVPGVLFGANRSQRRIDPCV